MILDDDDIEAIANRVAEKLRPRADGLVGVQDVARALGMSRGWVYRNADVLGARISRRADHPRRDQGVAGGLRNPPKRSWKAWNVPVRPR